MSTDLLKQSYNEYGIIVPTMEACFQFNDEEAVKFTELTEGRKLTIELSLDNSEISFQDSNNNRFKLFLRKKD